ncbi:MAG: universal stress protein [Syntrophorhabdales bacterium]|jgi:nucleotide-binding universal stress UspA family protein
MFKPTKILVPTDFSYPSDKALGEALGIAKQYSAAIHLLHVIPQELDYMCSVDYCVDASTMEQFQEKVLPGAHQSLRKQLEKFPLFKDVKIVTEVRKGHPAEEILKAQEEKEVDLIVMAPLGKTGLAKFFVGSVTNNIVRGARCLVLLVR